MAAMIMMRRRNQGDGIDSSISHAPPNKKSQSPVAAKHQTRHASTKVSKIMSCFFLLTFNLALYVLVGTPQKDPYADKEAHTRRKTVVLDNNHFKISSRRDDFPSENDDFPSEFLPPVATKNIGHLTTLQEQNKTADVSDPFTSNWLDELGPEWENQECVPMHRWQLPKYGYANCNAIHEIDLMDPVTDLATVNCGSSRCAFRINQGGHQMVIKIAKSSKNGYIPRNYKDNWLDTIIMERTTASPFVLDVHGSCGVSQLIEYANGGNVHDLISLSRKNGGTMTPLDKLKAGFHIASGTAAMHTMDSDNTPSLVHNDLCCHQFILIDGVYKLNDFNLASIVRKSRTDGSVCMEDPWHPNGKYIKLRPPEEVIGNGHKINRDKSDVWLMGNILYYILSNRWIFEHRSNRKAVELVLRGLRSEIPEEILNSSDPSDHAMIRGIAMAWTQDPDERPSARQIADFFYKELLERNGNNPNDYRISVPPLPPNYDFSTEDWYSNYKHDDRW